MWTFEVASSHSKWSNDGDEWDWKQEVDLETGSWTQELRVADVLIWADTWNTTNSMWNFNLVTGGPEIGMLSAIGEDSEDSGDGPSSAALAAGVLSLTLLGYCVFVRPGAQKTTDEF